MKTTLNDRLKTLLNYFSPSAPVTAPEGLKGRDRELNDALLFLLNGECIIVQGARRIGKTSFLHCLGKLCSKQGHHCIYISFQSLLQYNGQTFTDHLRRQLFSYLKIPNNLKTEQGIYDSLGRLGQFLDDKYDADEHFILFLDEFQLTEKFSGGEQYVFYNQLRDVIEERVIRPELRRFVFVVSTSQSLSELSVGVSSTLASSFPKTFSLGRISSDSCRDLIQHPFSGSIEMEDGATDLVIHESGGHPYLIKLLLHNIIIRNAADFSSAHVTSLVNREIVETQVTVLTEDLVHPHFEMLKNILDEVEIQILYEIDKHRKLGFLDIREAIISYFVKFRRDGQTSSVRIMLDRLQNLQILRKENELFCLANGIYQKWFSAFFEQYYVSEAIQEFCRLKPNQAVLEFDPVSSPEKFVQHIRKAILYLKKSFEEKGLWELAWKDKNQGVAHHERYLQKMTAALLDICLAPYNIIVEKEVESGAGPMDIKLILDRNLAACLEIKKSPGNVYHGLEVEMNAYMGTTIKIGFFVLFYLGGGTKLATVINKLESIVKKITINQPDKEIQTICIDCVPRKSASKRVERK